MRRQTGFHTHGRAENPHQQPGRRMLSYGGVTPLTAPQSRAEFFPYVESTRLGRRTNQSHVGDFDSTAAYHASSGGTTLDITTSAQHRGTMLQGRDRTLIPDTGGQARILPDHHRTRLTNRDDIGLTDYSIRHNHHPGTRLTGRDGSRPADNHRYGTQLTPRDATSLHPNPPAVTEHDPSMAQTQKRYERLTEAEKRSQDTWVFGILRLMGVCPFGFLWIRGTGGYQCQAGGH